MIAKWQDYMAEKPTIREDPLLWAMWTPPGQVVCWTLGWVALIAVCIAEHLRSRGSA